MKIVGKKDERNKALIDDRLNGNDGNGMSLQELGDKYGISRQRVDQILYEYGIINSKDEIIRNLAKRMYDYICEYKRNNDGNSPGTWLLRNEAKFYTSSRVRRALNYLQDTNMIEITKGNYSRDRDTPFHINVIGAKWIPPPDYGDIT